MKRDVAENVDFVFCAADCCCTRAGRMKRVKRENGYPGWRTNCPISQESLRAPRNVSSRRRGSAKLAAQAGVEVGGLWSQRDTTVTQNNFHASAMYKRDGQWT